MARCRSWKKVGDPALGERTVSICMLILVPSTTSLCSMWSPNEFGVATRQGVKSRTSTCQSSPLLREGVEQVTTMIADDEL